MSPPRRDAVGIIPAAGLGTRLRPFRYPKELLPITFAEAPGGLRPMLAIEVALRALLAAGVTHALTVVSSTKLELVRLLGDGSALGMHLAYLHQADALGLADAVDRAFPWVDQRSCFLVLPDTLFSPPDALLQVRDLLEEGDADLVLGLFPTDRPEQLGPVRIDGEGRVVEVLEKPSQTDLGNTWGIAGWGPRFTDFLHHRCQAEPEARRASIGLAFHAAAQADLDVRAVFFPHGTYRDVGTAQALAELVLPAERGEP